MVLIKALLSQQMVVCQSSLHRRIDMTKIQWFSDVIERTCAHGFNRRVDALLSANHHHDGIGSSFQNQRYQIKTTDPSHIDVTDYQIEIDAVENRQCSFRRA